MTTTTSSTSLSPSSRPSPTPRLALAGFLVGYRGLTREAYTLNLPQFTA